MNLIKKICLLLVVVCSAQLVAAEKGLSLDLSDIGNSNPLNIYLGPSYIGGIGVMVMADYETPMFTDHLTIGPSVGLGTVTYTDVYRVRSGFYDTYSSGTYTAVGISVGGVGHYYFDWLIPNMSDKYDLFAKANVGMVFYSRKYSGSYVGFRTGVQAGGRINFSESFSLYGALGYGVTLANIGISLKL